MVRLAPFVLLTFVTASAGVERVSLEQICLSVHGKLGQAVDLSREWRRFARLLHSDTRPRDLNEDQNGQFDEVYRVFVAYKAFLTDALPEERRRLQRNCEYWPDMTEVSQVGQPRKYMDGLSFAVGDDEIFYRTRNPPLFAPDGSAAPGAGNAGSTGWWQSWWQGSWQAARDWAESWTNFDPWEYFEDVPGWRQAFNDWQFPSFAGFQGAAAPETPEAAGRVAALYGELQEEVVAMVEELERKVEAALQAKGQLAKEAVDEGLLQPDYHPEVTVMELFRKKFEEAGLQFQRPPDSSLTARKLDEHWTLLNVYRAVVTSAQQVLRLQAEAAAAAAGGSGSSGLDETLVQQFLSNHDVWLEILTRERRKARHREADLALAIITENKTRLQQIKKDHDRMQAELTPDADDDADDDDDDDDDDESTAEPVKQRKQPSQQPAPKSPVKWAVWVGVAGGVAVLACTVAAFRRLRKAREAAASAEEAAAPV